MASPELAELYSSLLMTLAYAWNTRVDRHVYVVALQRRAAAPLRGQDRNIHALVRWARQHPVRLHYPPMHRSMPLEIHSDAAF